MARITIGTPQGGARGGGSLGRGGQVTKVVGAATNLREQDFIGPGRLKAQETIAKVNTVSSLIDGAAGVVDEAVFRRNILNEQDDNVQAQKSTAEVQRQMQLIFNGELETAEKNNRDVSADTIRTNTLKRVGELVSSTNPEFSTDSVREKYNSRISELVKNNDFQLTISDELEKYTVNRVKDGLQLTADAQVNFLGGPASSLDDLQQMDNYVANLYGSEIAAAVYGADAAQKGRDVLQQGLTAFMSKTMQSGDIGSMNAVERVLTDPESFASLDSEARIVALSRLEKGRNRAIKKQLNKEKDARVEFLDGYVRETNQGLKTSQQINNDFNRGVIDYSTFTRALRLNADEEKASAEAQMDQDFVRSVLSGDVAMRPKGVEGFNKKEDKKYDIGVQSKIEQAREDGASAEDITRLRLGFVERTGYVSATDRREINDGVLLNNPQALELAVNMVITNDKTYTQFETRTQDAINYARRGLSFEEAILKAGEIANTTPLIREERRKNVNDRGGQVGEAREEAIESILETAGVRGFGEGFAGLGINLDEDDATELARAQIRQTYNLEYLRLGDTEQAKVSAEQFMKRVIGINPDSNKIESLPPTLVLYGEDEGGKGVMKVGEKKWGKFRDTVRLTERVPEDETLVRRIVPRTVGSDSPEYQVWQVAEGKPDIQLRRGIDNKLIRWSPNPPTKTLEQWRNETKLQINDTKIQAAKAKLDRRREIKGEEEVRIQQINQELALMPQKFEIPGVLENEQNARRDLIDEKSKLLGIQEAREKSIIQDERQKARKR